MPIVNISQDVLGKPEAIFKKLRKYCDQKLILKEVGNLKPEVAWEEEEKKGTFEEKGVKGTIRVRSTSPCKITVTMEIPFYLIPFKGLLTESIQKHLGKFA